MLRSLYCLEWIASSILWYTYYHVTSPTSVIMCITPSRTSLRKSLESRHTQLESTHTEATLHIQELSEKLVKEASTNEQLKVSTMHVQDQYRLRSKLFTPGQFC